MKGTPKQQDALKVLTDTTTTVLLYGGAAGGGKSFLGCFWLMVNCLAYPDTKWFIAREELKRIRQSTLITFFKVSKMIEVNCYKVNNNDNFIEFSNGSRIDLLDIRRIPSDPLYERFGSTEYTGGWIEEAGETDYGAFEVLKTRIGRHLNDVYNLKRKILITSNPKKNWLYRLIYKPWTNGTLSNDTKFIQAYYSDNDNLTEDYIQGLNEIKDASTKARLKSGDWEYENDPTSLCEHDDIVALFNNTHVQPTGKKYITADIARLGSDKAVIVVWDGWTIIEYVEYDVSKTTEIQNAINTLRAKHSIAAHKCIADEDGVGGGVVDNCRIKGFVNNSKPLKIVNSGAVQNENYYNLQSQCCYKLAEIINANKLYIKADMPTITQQTIIEDLEQLKTYQVDNEQKLRVLPKKIIKENIGRSPDWRDVIMMRYWFELSPVGNYGIGG